MSNDKTPEEAAEEVPATFAFREAENNGYERGKREERERIWEACLDAHRNQGTVHMEDIERIVLWGNDEQ